MSAHPALRRRELTGLFGTLSADELEAVEADLALRDPEELAREFGRAEELLRGLETTAETSLGYHAELVLWEARRLAGLARGACEAQAK